MYTALHWAAYGDEPLCISTLVQVLTLLALLVQTYTCGHLRRRYVFVRILVQTYAYWYKRTHTHTGGAACICPHTMHSSAYCWYPLVQSGADVQALTLLALLVQTYTYGHLRRRYVFLRVLRVCAGAVWRGCACVHVCGPNGARRSSLSRQHPSVSRTYPQVRALSKKKKYTWYIYKKVHIVYKKKVRKNVHIAWATPAGGVATARHTEVCMYVLRATNTRRSTSIRTWVCRALIRWCFSTLSLYHCACRTLIRRRSLYLLYWYKSTRTTMCVLILPRTAIYVSSYY